MHLAQEKERRAIQRKCEKAQRKVFTGGISKDNKMSSHWRILIASLFLVLLSLHIKNTNAAALPNCGGGVTPKTLGSINPFDSTTDPTVNGEDPIDSWVDSPANESLLEESAGENPASFAITQLYTHSEASDNYGNDIYSIIRIQMEKQRIYKSTF